MKSAFLLLLLMTSVFSGAWTQDVMKLFINGKEEPLNKPYYKVAATDSVRIHIQLPSSVQGNAFLTKVEAKVCEYNTSQNQSQQQRVKDRVVLFNKLSDALRKKNTYHNKPIVVSDDGQIITISFTGNITSCIDKFFWINLSNHAAYNHVLASIKNYKSSIRLKRKNA